MLLYTHTSLRRIRFVYVHAQCLGPRWPFGNDPQLEFITTSEASALAGVIEESAPDIVLIDAKLLEAAWRNIIASTDIPCILLGSASLDQCGIPFLIAGARGHLLDEELPDKLREAAEVVLGNNVYAGPALTWRLFARLSSLSGRVTDAVTDETPSTTELTIAETRILNLIASGLTNRSIAESLCVSPHTVANHVHNLLRKLKVRNRWEAVSLSESTEGQAIAYNPI